jgi:hypothetical protein
MAKKIKKFDEGGMATDPNYMPSTTPEVAAPMPAAPASKGPSPDQIKLAMALATQGTKSMGGAAAAGQGMGGMGGGSQAGRIVPAAPAAYKKGGAVMKMDKEQDKAMIKKAFKQHDMQEHKGGKGTSLKLKMGGMSGCGYDKGGMAMVKKDGKMVPGFAADGKGKMKHGGKISGMHMMPDGSMMKNSAMMKGGKVKTCAKGGGIEVRGKTRGKIC